MYKLCILLMCSIVFGYRQDCNENTVLQRLKISTYDFSVGLLERVAQETDGHFVYSPVSTWLQLLALSDGANGVTLTEIRNVTRHNMICSTEFVRKIFNNMDTDLSDTIKHRSTFVIDKLLKVKESFVNNVESLNAAKVLESGFGENAKINETVDFDVSGVLNDDDLMETVLLLTDVASMKVNWKNPFNPVYTNKQTFYSDERVPIGNVNMMFQSGYFNYFNMPEIRAQAVELPFNGRTSMILLLPYTGAARDLFFKMSHVRIASITRVLYANQRLINLSMPRFNLTTLINNTPELLYDMGVKRMFSPHYAEFNNISDHKVYVSLMANKFAIEVNERGVSAVVAPETLGIHEEPVNMSFNRPFAFMLVDRLTSVILYAGVYSKPSQ